MAVTQQQHQQHISGWTTWIGVAGILLTFSGIYNLLLGLGGIFGQDWYIYTTNATWIFDSSAWGWSMVAGGVLMILSAWLLLIGNMVGRVLGVLIGAASLVANAAMFAAAPVWSGLAIALDLAIIYAIIAHGGEMKHAREHFEDH